MHGWGSSARRTQLPPNWPKLRAQARKRANGQCQATDDGVRCPLAGTDCDHIGDPYDHSLDNLQWLCRDHHQIKTIAERPAPIRVTTRRRPERHPGLR